MGEPSRSHLDDIGPDTPTDDLAKSLRFVAKWSLSPPHPVPLQEAARRLDRMVELEAIVAALAASKEPECWYGGVPICALCNSPLDNGEPRHARGCPWLRAKAWVEANPEET